MPASFGAVWRWFQLEGNRLVVSGLVLVVLFVVIGPLGHAFTGPVSDPLGERHSLVPAMSTLLSGNFLLVSIVVSISSVFVTQEQSPLAQQFGRIQSIVEFRRQLEDVVDRPHVPSEPSRLLQLLSGDILQRAQYLDEQLPAAEFELRADIDAYLDSLAAETGEMNAQLEDAETTLDIVLATMDFNHDQQVNDLRWLQAEYGDDLPDEVEETIQEMLELLQYFATAREYFKTLYLRREFAALSKHLIYVAVPTITIISFALLHLNRIPGIEGTSTLLHIVAFAPFAVLATYTVRVATVSQNTQAAGQFVVDQRAGDVQGIPREED